MLDALASGDAPSPIRRRTPASLRPGPSMMDAAARGSVYALAVRDAWRFSSPVTVMSSTELDNLSARCATTFTGRLSDRSEVR